MPFDDQSNPQQARPEWSTPVLTKLGTIRDIAGPKGGTLTNGLNRDRIPS
ncbi:hypothetical protein [Qipengyuania marisflavi]|nr:hypothetical protein [Qipengyuania marisflavi]